MLGFDHQRRPTISYHKADAQGDTQPFIARLESGRWVLHQVTNWPYRWDYGGDGALDPEAELLVGSHGFVGEHGHLNPCRRLRIGDEVVVSRGAVVMAHSFGESVLRGYPSRFAGVTIGDGAQLGIGAVLFPGVEVGAGAILLSGSSLVSSVPPGRLFGGVSARDLKASLKAQPAQSRSGKKDTKADGSPVKALQAIVGNFAEKNKGILAAATAALNTRNAPGRPSAPGRSCVTRRSAPPARNQSRSRTGSGPSATTRH